MAEKKKPSRSVRPRKKDAAKASAVSADLGKDSLKAAEEADNTSADRAADSTPDATGQDSAAPDEKAGTVDALAGGGPADTGAESDSDLPEDDATTGVQTDTAPEGATPEDTAKESEAPEEGAAAPGADDETSHETPHPEPADDSAAPALVPVAPMPERKPAFWPMVWGGIVAAGIGAGLAYVILPQLGVLGLPDADFRDEVTRVQAVQTEQIAVQADDIETLRSAVAEAREAAAASGSAGDAPDLSGIEATQSDLQTQMAALSDQVAGLGAKVSALGSRPASGGSSVTQGEITALQQMLATQQAELAALSADAAAQEAAAQASAAATLQRAALTRIRTSLDTGTGFAGALGDLEAAGQDVPDALRAVAAEGAPSLASLRDAFPPAARIALAEARKELGDSGEAPAGVMAFLSDQLGARSLEPREGDDPDAILSRAEFALREARLGDALAEIETLPPSGRAALADWAESARIRMDATRAVDALGAELN